MSRSEDLEQILACLFELDHCDPTERYDFQATLQRKLEALTRQSGISRDELLAAVYFRYIDYRRKRRADERKRSAR